MALYFAYQNCGPEFSRSSIVWMPRVPKSEIVLPSSKTSPFEVKSTKVFRPTIISHRMTAQAGWFSAHKFVSKRPGFVPLDKNKAYKESLAKLEVRLSPGTVLTFLARVGISPVSLFPELEGLCKHLNEHAEFSISDWEFLPMPRAIGEPESPWNDKSK